MKNSYKLSSVFSRLTSSWAFLLVLLALPLGSQAQTFLETGGTVGTEGNSPVQHDNQNRFVNSAPFRFTGNADISLLNPSPGSGGVSVAFPNVASPAANATFFISEINTSTLNNIQVSFAIYNPAATPVTTSQFRVAAGTPDGTVNGQGLPNYTYTNLAYTYAAGSGNWGTITVTGTVPSAPQISLRFLRLAAAQSNGVYQIDDVQLTGATATPTLTVNPTDIIFSNVQVGNASTRLITLTGSVNDVVNVVTAPSGPFTLRLAGSGNAFTSSIVIPRPSPSNTIPANTQVEVRYAPTAVGNTSGSVTFSSTGAADAVTNLFGSAVAAPPVVAITESGLTFPNTQAGRNSAPQPLTVTGSNLTGTVTLSSNNNDFELLNPATGTYTTGSITLNTGGASSINQQIQVRFSPKTPVAVNTVSSGLVTVTTQGSTSTDNATVSGTNVPQPTGPFVFADPSALNFGTVSGTGSADNLTFEVGGGNLGSNPIVLTRTNSAIQFRVAGSGAFTNNASLTIPSVNGQVPTTTIEVRLRNVPSGAFNGRIDVTTPASASATASVTITANNPFTGTNTNSSVTALTTNQAGAPLLPTFSTVPGRPSSSASYKITGENLVRPITVTAPANFQIAKDSLFTGISDNTSANGNTLTFNPTNGNVTPQRVYVRYNPLNRNQHSENTSNVSNPATEVLVSVRGNSEPNIAIAGDFTFDSKVVINEFSTVQPLQLTAERVLADITISVEGDTGDPGYNPAQTPQFQISLDNVTFFYTLVVTPDQTTASINRPLYVRYAPTRVGNPLAKLRFRSADTGPTTFDFVNSANQVSSSLSGFGLAIEPTQRTSFVAVRSGDGTTASVTFTNLPTDPEAAGFGKLRLVVVSENPTLLAPTQNPVDGTDYSPGQQGYKSGSKLPNPAAQPGVTDPNYYVVYASDTESATFTGLTPSTDYYIFVFDYNSNNPGVNAVQAGAANFLTPTEQETLVGVLIDSPLPVELTAFSAKVNGKQVDLAWTTASEKNNKGFEVQRSSDAKNFQTITFVQGNGSTTNTHNYTSIDRAPLTGTAYYRLKQVDNDGTMAYSEVKTVTLGTAGTLSLYPNPVQNNVTIQLPVAQQNASVQVLDLAGRVVLTRALGANGSLSLSDLQRGTYLVRVQQGSQQWTQKIVKQ